MSADVFALQVPVPVTKISESEILPARIAPQLRSAESSPKADSEAQDDTHESLEQASAGLWALMEARCLFDIPRN